MSKKPIRLLLWAAFGSGKDYWGPGISAYKLYEQLNDQRLHITLVHGYPNQEEHEVYDDFKFIGELKSDIISQLQFIYKAKKWIKKNANSFDVAHVLTPYHYSFMPALWLENLGVPTVIKITNYEDGLGKSSLLSRLLFLNWYKIKKLHCISGFIAISSDISQDLLSHNVEKTRIHDIPNGVDTQKFSPVLSHKKEELKQTIGLPNRLTVLFCGGVSERKNPSALVGAIAYLYREKKIEINGLIVGPDRYGVKETEKIKRIICNSDIGHLIKRIDFTPDVERFYKASDLFVLPSRNEGMSNSLLEAVASGLPAIVTNISGSNEIVTNGINGYITDGTEKEIADCILRYLTQEKLLLRHSLNARKTAESRYQSNRILQKHIELFFELADRK